MNLCRQAKELDESLREAGVRGSIAKYIGAGEELLAVIDEMGAHPFTAARVSSDIVEHQATLYDPYMYKHYSIKNYEIQEQIWPPESNKLKQIRIVADSDSDPAFSLVFMMSEIIKLKIAYASRAPRC